MYQFKINTENIKLFHGDCIDFLGNLESRSIQLIITSPPYSIGKEYEINEDFDKYIEKQKNVLESCYSLLSDTGSLCYQTGNFINNSEILPLDIPVYNICKSLGLKLRNRIIWHFGHGLHCKKRFSGRYETIMWFTKSDDYVFNLDCVRIPQKYPNKKHFKGAKKGDFSCNPLGKNPEDVWKFEMDDFWSIPNVKHNHCEKTKHPCQFPFELCERLILALSNKGSVVLDPYVGSGTAMCAALKYERKAFGSDYKEEYISIAADRINQTLEGNLIYR